MIVQVITQHWELSKWWRNFIILSITAGITTFYISYLFTPDIQTQLSSKSSKYFEFPFAVLAFIDFYKDIIYIRRFVHFYKTSTFLLYFSVTSPFVVIYLLLNIPQVSNTSLYQTTLIYFGWDNICRSGRTHVKNKEGFFQVIQ